MVGGLFSGNGGFLKIGCLHYISTFKKRRFLKNRTASFSAIFRKAVFSQNRTAKSDLYFLSRSEKLKYRTLKSVFHQHDHVTATELENRRRSEESSIHWPFSVSGQDTIFCVLTPEIVGLVESISRASVRIMQLWSIIPGAARDHYLYSLLLDEVVATNDIEGVYSSRQIVHEALQSTTTKARFAELARLYQRLSSADRSLPFSLDELRSLYDSIMANEPIADHDVLDGDRFRAHSVQVWDTARQKPVHSGFQPESKINAGLEVFLSTQERTDASRLIHATAAHFIFEVIHPFYDGNGRTGRFLLGAAVSEILTPVTALSLSRVIHLHKGIYYRAFGDAEEPLNHGDLTPFVTTMLGLIESAQNDLIEDLGERQLVLEGLNQQIDTVAQDPPPGWKERHVKIMYILAQAQLFSSGQPIGLEEMAHTLNLKKAQVRPATRLLEEQDHIFARSLNPLEFELTASGLALMGLNSDLS